MIRIEAGHYGNNPEEICGRLNQLAGSSGRNKRVHVLYILEVELTEKHRE